MYVRMCKCACVFVYVCMASMHVCCWCVCSYLWDFRAEYNASKTHVSLTQAEICGPPSGHGVQPLGGASVQGVRERLLERLPFTWVENVPPWSTHDAPQGRGGLQLGRSETGQTFNANPSKTPQNLALRALRNICLQILSADIGLFQIYQYRRICLPICRPIWKL